MKLIVAVDEKWGIGKNRDLLLSIPDDMRYFRQTTRDAVLVMGYNTLLSFPGSKPLPGRLNIVLSDIEGCTVNGAVVCNTMEQLFALLSRFDSDDVYVIGGGMMYTQLLPYCDTAYITKMRFDGGADTFIPNLDEIASWRVADESEMKDYEGVRYSFVTYQNTEPKPIGFSSTDGNLSQYFKKKAELVVDFADCGDVQLSYHAHLASLLCAYFRPLEKGANAAGVDDFLRSDTNSFEQYLRGTSAIAAVEDFARLAVKYPSQKTCPVTLSKENYIEFIQALQSRNYAQIMQEFTGA